MKSIVTKIISLSALVAVTTSLSAYAQSADQTQPTTSTATVGTTPAAPAKTGDIDDEITNAKLRAVTGAKSKYSFWSSFGYAGASIVNPLSTQRPQLNSQNNADPTNLSGQVSGKYRLTEHDSLIVGVGVQYTPSHTDSSQNQIGTTTTVQSPYIDYNRAFRLGETQNVVDVSVSKYTLADDLNANLNWGWSVQHVLMREVGASKKLTLGVASFLSQDVYTADGQAPGSLYMQGGIEPIVEYAITEKLSFRTVYRMYMVNEIYGTNGVWAQAKQTESMGLGYAITRDIYVYPNMQWPWNRVAADQTTVGFSANINL